jgi:hypothetical protein
MQALAQAWQPAIYINLNQTNTLRHAPPHTYLKEMDLCLATHILKHGFEARAQRLCKTFQLIPRHTALRAGMEAGLAGWATENAHLHAGFARRQHIGPRASAMGTSLQQCLTMAEAFYGHC